MIYTTYNPSNGQILNIITTSDDNINNPNLQGRTFILGRFEGSDYYVDNGQPVAKPRDPSTATAKYDFDYTTKSWVLNTDKSIAAAKAIRDTLFKDIDKMNPIWYNSLTTEQQQELQTYRQALLDITNQAGFPTAVNWPDKPTWL